MLRHLKKNKQGIKVGLHVYPCTSTFLYIYKNENSQESAALGKQVSFIKHILCLPVSCVCKPNEWQMQSRKACMRTWWHHFLHENNVHENPRENPYRVKDISLSLNSWKRDS